MYCPNLLTRTYSETPVSLGSLNMSRGVDRLDVDVNITGIRSSDPLDLSFKPLTHQTTDLNANDQLQLQLLMEQRKQLVNHVAVQAFQHHQMPLLDAFYMSSSAWPSSMQRNVLSLDAPLSPFPMDTTNISGLSVYHNPMRIIQRCSSIHWERR